MRVTIQYRYPSVEGGDTTQTLHYVDDTEEVGTGDRPMSYFKHGPYGVEVIIKREDRTITKFWPSASIVEVTTEQRA